jgi:hypothetical protein
MQSLKKKIFSKAMFLLLAFALLLPMNIGVLAADECCGAHSEEEAREAAKEVVDLHADECCDHDHSEDEEKDPEDEKEEEPPLRASTVCQFYGHSYGGTQYSHAGTPCYKREFQQCTRSGCGDILYGATIYCGESHKPPIVHTHGPNCTITYCFIIAWVDGVPHCNYHGRGCSGSVIYYICN